MKPTAILSHLLVLLLFTCASSEKYTPLLWERPIYDALNNRDNYYNKVGIKHDKATLNMLLTPKGSEALKEQLDSNKDESNAWYHFLYGIVNLRSSDLNEAVNFTNAIVCANNDPGTFWVLFLEFHQTKQEQWADTCLKKLERYFLSIGAQSAPILSQQLLAMAKSEKGQGNNLSFRKYTEWSARFERYPFWQTFMRGWGTLPQHPQVFIDACKECKNMIRTSWLLQLTLLYYLYQWFWLAISFFVVILFVILCTDIMPIALHPIIEIFPLSISPRLRYLFTIIMFVSLSIFGIIPFFLLATFIMWQYAKKWKKIFLVICFSFLVLSPLDARIRDLFRVSLSKDTPLGLFRKATSEGWHIDLENKIMENLKIDDTDYLSHISAAIFDLKKNEVSSSINHILNAEKFKANDPVVLTTTGNIYNAAGETKLAQTFYKKCVEIFPDYAAARFNLGQLNFYMKNSSESTEQIAHASDLNPDLINGFIEKNAYYFSDTLPIQRQFIQSDFRPGYFWKNVFPSYMGSWEGAKKIWGLNFLGISPLLFPFIVVILIILLIIVRKIYPYSGKKLFCKLCGSPMCKKCRIGQLCHDCVQITESTREEPQKKQLKSKIKNRRKRLIQLTTIFLNLLFPGAGKFYKEDKINISGIVLIAITSCIYATYIALFTFDFSYPFWVIKNCFTVIFLCLLIYNLFFIITSLKGLLFELRSKEDAYVVSWKSQ